MVSHVEHIFRVFCISIASGEKSILALKGAYLVSPSAAIRYPLEAPSPSTIGWENDWLGRISAATPRVGKIVPSFSIMYKLFSLYL